ncbi:hypothetical protein PENTCL1PPCAC_19254, partial [Pristionchus entomophagus]
TLVVVQRNKITAKALHQVYKVMLDKSSRFQRLSICKMPENSCVALFNLIGITFRNGQFYTSRDIEVYKPYHEYPEDYDDDRSTIFDGHLQIDIAHKIVNGQGRFDFVVYAHE